MALKVIALDYLLDGGHRAGLRIIIIWLAQISLNQTAKWLGLTDEIYLTLSAQIFS